MSEEHTWAACVEGREEEGYFTGDTREEALAAAIEGTVEDVDTGWADPGKYDVELNEGCVWHHRCDDERCDYCPSSDEHDMWLHDWEERHRVVVEVFYKNDNPDPDLCSADWREVPEET